MRFPLLILLLTFNLWVPAFGTFSHVVFAQESTQKFVDPEAEDPEAGPKAEATAAGDSEAPSNSPSGIQAPVPGAQSAFASQAGASSSDSRVTVPFESSQSVQEVLKSIISNYQSKLKDLEPWQKRLFAEEVVGQHSRFIKDYRMNGSVLQVEIDADAIKKFLAYHYNAKGDKTKEVRMGIYIRSAGDCVRCGAALPKIKPLAVGRLERRGFSPVWIMPQDLRDLSGKSSGLQLTGKALEDRILQLAARKGWMGAMVIQMQIAANDPGDTAHADEKRTAVRSAILFRDIPGGIQKADRQEGSLEVLESDPVDPSVGRLLSDAFTDLGAKVLALGGLNLNQDAGEETAVFVTGVRDFSVYQMLRSALQERVQGLGTLEDRMFAKGKVRFSVRSMKPFPEIKAALTTIQLQAPYRYAFRGEGFGWDENSSANSSVKGLRAEVQYGK
ncbi:MAG: hypothetical protein JNL01_10120 [Bdellovibrionales bacterium]|nr:hypothetical protein [Bdellovibrionales bacterium]